VRAELQAFHLRRSQPDEAETAAKAALAIDSGSLEAHRVQGPSMPATPTVARRRPRAASRSRVSKDAITHLEQASASTWPAFSC
jgi:hypothetical protein